MPPFDYKVTFFSLVLTFIKSIGSDNSNRSYRQRKKKTKKHVWPVLSRYLSNEASNKGKRMCRNLIVISLTTPSLQLFFQWICRKYKENDDCG